MGAVNNPPPASPASFSGGPLAFQASAAGQENFARPTLLLPVASYLVGENPGTAGYYYVGVTNDDQDNIGSMGTGSNGALIAQARGAAWNGTGFDRVRTPSAFATGAFSAAGSTQLVAGIGGELARIVRYSIELSEDATLAAAGRLTIQLFIGAASIGLAHTVWVPAVALTTTSVLYQSGLIDLGPVGLVTPVNTAINVNLSAALATGVATVNLMYLQGAHA